jgi:hypothetical membrane protein
MAVPMPVRTSATCWVLVANYFVVQFFAQAAWPSSYSLARNPISDLGAVHCATSEISGYVCSPWHAAMNTSFILTGVLIAAGAFRLHRLGAGSTASTALIALGAAGWILVGSFPSDTVLSAHQVGALLAFVPGNLGMLVYARPRGYSPVVILSMLGLFAAVVLLGVLPILGPAANAVGGAIERVTAWPFPLAVTICGVLRLVGRTDDSRTSTTAALG